MKSDTSKGRVNSLALKSALWGFWGFLLWPVGPGLAIYYGHTVLHRNKNNPAKYTGADKRMAIGGLLFGYSSFLGWSYVIYLSLKVFLFMG